MPKAASAQVSESALASRPTWVFAEAEVRLDERHQEVERVAVEEDDAEIEAQQADEPGPGSGRWASVGGRRVGGGGGAHRNGLTGSRAVPVDRGPPEAGEGLLHAVGRADQLEEARIAGMVEIGDVAAGRHAGAPGERVAARFEFGDVGIDVVAWRGRDGGSRSRSGRSSLCRRSGDRRSAGSVRSAYGRQRPWRWRRRHATARRDRPDGRRRNDRAETRARPCNPRPRRRSRP